MKSYLLSGVIDTRHYLAEYDSDLIQRLFEVLKIIDSLYNLENDHNNLINIESYLYGEIIRLLRSCACFLDKCQKDFFLSRIDSIENGLFDIEPIELHIENKSKLILLFGKVCAPCGKKSYSGALGVEDNSFEQLLSQYKMGVLKMKDNPGSLKRKYLERIHNINTKFRCMNAARFSGYLNRMHLPISIFFSGGGHESRSALSNTYLFTNIYFDRYNIISEKLGGEFIAGYKDSTVIDDNSIHTVLVLWLWGHDIGHFVVDDNFPKKLDESDRYIYEIFHELWSDLFSLYLLKRLTVDFTGIGEETICLVFLSEMLRYIRKGGFMMYPDSASAIITYRCLIGRKILIIDKSSGIIRIDYSKFYIMIDELLQEVGTLFSGGEVSELKKYMSSSGIRSNFSNSDEIIGIDMNNGGLPSYISILEM